MDDYPFELKNVTISEASESDINALATIHVAAFRSDNAVRLMYSDGEQEKAVAGMLASQMTDPTNLILKATSRVTKEILAWSGYTFVGKESSDLKKKAVPSIGNVKEGLRGMGHLMGTQTIVDNSHKLAACLHENDARMEKEWMLNKRYYQINTLVTDPAHQGHEIATALIHAITASADRSHVPCWLKSSPAAYGVYVRAGFESVETLEADLSEFAQGGEGSVRGWGVYVFSYMLRLPKT